MKKIIRNVCRPVLLGVAVLTAGCATNASAPSGYRASQDDFVQIYELFARYNYAINVEDGMAWANTFTVDGVFQDPSNCAIGPKALADVVGHARHPAQELRVFHYSTPGVITYADRDHATVHSTVFLVSETGFGKPGGIAITGTYDDHLRRVDGQWKFAYRFVQRPNRGPPIPCAAQAASGFRYLDSP